MTEGGNASISCELLEEEESIEEDISLSIFTWTREGLQFTNTGKYTHLGTELRFDNVTKSDAGFYFCTTKARNGNSLVKSTITHMLYIE